MESSLCSLLKSKTRAKGQRPEGSVTAVQSSGTEAAHSGLEGADGTVCRQKQRFYETSLEGVKEFLSPRNWQN